VSEGAEDGGAAGAVVLEDVLGGAGRVNNVAAAGGGVTHGGRRRGARVVLAPLVISGELVGEVAVAVRGRRTVELGEARRSDRNGMGRYTNGATGIRNSNQIRPNSQHTDFIPVGYGCTAPRPETHIFYPVQTM